MAVALDDVVADHVLQGFAKEPEWDWKKTVNEVAERPVKIVVEGEVAYECKYKILASKAVENNEVLNLALEFDPHKIALVVHRTGVGGVISYRQESFYDYGTGMKLDEPAEKVDFHV